MKYNKIVRDKIPEVIRADQKECIVKLVSGEEKLEYLLEKLLEESNELAESRTVEELADVQEVLNAIASALNITLGDLERVRSSKYNERGGFDSGIVLLEVNKKDD